jgi:hypothetical protein
MEAQEKAKELVDKMLYCYQGHIDEYTAKQCALIAVDEVLNEYKSNETFTQPVSSRVFMYKRIKQEIEKL